MDRSYWQQQQKGRPLFPDMEWSRPEHRLAAGKLLIIGGNLHGFAAPAEAYAEAGRAGIGTCRVLLPSAIQKIVGQLLTDGEYAPSTPSGSFSQKALSDVISFSSWADGVLVAGDLGHNSETAILLEKFLATSRAAITLAKDAVDYVVAAPGTAVGRENTLLVLSLSQLQRLSIATRFPQAVTFGMDLLHLAEWLHAFTTAHKAYVAVKHHDQLLVATNGRVSSTRLAPDLPIWRVKVGAHTAVWWLQNPNRPFEAITTAVATL